MVRPTVEDVIGSVKDRVSEAKDVAAEAAHDLADRVEAALEDATTEGRKVAKKARKELARRWQVVDRAGRDNAFLMALGALGVGIVIGYLISRDRD